MTYDQALANFGGEGSPAAWANEASNSKDFAGFKIERQGEAVSGVVATTNGVELMNRPDNVSVVSASYSMLGGREIQAEVTAELIE